MLEKVLQKSLMSGSKKSKPLTNYSIGEENDDDEINGRESFE